MLAIRVPHKLVIKYEDTSMFYLTTAVFSFLLTSQRRGFSRIQKKWSRRARLARGTPYSAYDVGGMFLLIILSYIMLKMILVVAACCISCCFKVLSLCRRHFVIE